MLNALFITTFIALVVFFVAFVVSKDQPIVKKVVEYIGSDDKKENFSLYDLLDCAVDDLIERINEVDDFIYFEDNIHEIADSNVPIYYYQLLQYAANNTELAVNEPELGPAFDGSATPTNIIAANIYEELTNRLYEFWNEVEDHVKSVKEDETCPDCGSTMYETCVECSFNLDEYLEETK